MVVETTGLIEGQDEEGLVPLGAGAECVVDVLDKGLSIGDQASWVHGACALSAAGRVDEGEFGQGACCGIGVEVRQWLGLVGVVAGESPVKEESVDHVGACVVVLPGVVGF